MERVSGEGSVFGWMKQKQLQAAAVAAVCGALGGGQPLQAAEAMTSGAGAAATSGASAGTSPMAGGPAAAAPSGVGLETQGYLFSRFERREGFSSASTKAGDLVRYRALLTLTTTPIQINQSYTLQVRFAPQVGGYWGTGGDTLEDPGLILHEAEARLTMPGFLLEAGRFEMAYGDQALIGPSRWGNVGRAFDGLRLHAQKDKQSPWLDLFATQLDEVLSGENVPSTNLMSGDTLFAGAYAGLGALVPGRPDLEFYALGLIQPGYETDDGLLHQNSLRMTLGSRLKGKLKWWDFRLEGGIQAGGINEKVTTVDDAGVETITYKDSSLMGYQVMAETGVTLPVAKGLRLGLEGFYASGDDPATTDKKESWFQLYPTAHKWLGLMDVLNTRSNLYGSVGYLKLDPFGFLTVQGEAYMFWQPFYTDSAGVLSQDQYQGMELDGTLLYRIGKGMTVKAIGGLFIKPDVLVDVTDPYAGRFKYAELELGTTF